MRRASTLTIVLFNALFVVCALVLIVALIALGVGLLAVVSVFVSVFIFLFLPWLPTAPAPVFVRRTLRRSFPRAPPRF